MLIVIQYLCEAMLALIRGDVTLYGWRPDEVVAHHLTVGLVFAPVCLGCALIKPLEWINLLRGHAPAVRAPCDFILPAYLLTYYHTPPSHPLTVTYPHTRTHRPSSPDDSQVSVIASSAITGGNEGFFVLRPFLPANLANTSYIRRVHHRAYLARHLHGNQR